MTIISWNQGFCVGVKQVDEQHKKLVDMLNTLSLAMGNNQGRAALAELMGEIKEYARIHFQTEEAMMIQYAYPELDAHKGEHARFVETVRHSEAGYAQGEVSAFEVWTFLREWLMDHIMETDFRMGRFLNDQGVE